MINKKVLCGSLLSILLLAGCSGKEPQSASCKMTIVDGIDDVIKLEAEGDNLVKMTETMEFTFTEEEATDIAEEDMQEFAEATIPQLLDAEGIEADYRVEGNKGYIDLVIDLKTVDQSVLISMGMLESNSKAENVRISFDESLKSMGSNGYTCEKDE